MPDDIDLDEIHLDDADQDELDQAEGKQETADEVIDLTEAAKHEDAEVLALAGVGGAGAAATGDVDGTTSPPFGLDGGSAQSPDVDDGIVIDAETGALELHGDGTPQAKSDVGVRPDSDSGPASGADEEGPESGGVDEGLTTEGEAAPDATSTMDAVDVSADGTESAADEETAEVDLGTLAKQTGSMSGDVDHGLEDPDIVLERDEEPVRPGWWQRFKVWLKAKFQRSKKAPDGAKGRVARLNRRSGGLTAQVGTLLRLVVVIGAFAGAALVISNVDLVRETYREVVPSSHHEVRVVEVNRGVSTGSQVEVLTDRNGATLYTDEVDTVLIFHLGCRSGGGLSGTCKSGHFHDVDRIVLDTVASANTRPLEVEIVGCPTQACAKGTRDSDFIDSSTRVTIGQDPGPHVVKVQLRESRWVVLRVLKTTAEKDGRTDFDLAEVRLFDRVAKVPW